MTKSRLLTMCCWTLLSGSMCASTIEGTVVDDQTGEVQPHAQVRILVLGTRTVVADLETDHRGRFRSADVVRGDYGLDVSQPNYISTSLQLRVPGRSILVRLLRCGVITGQISDLHGLPLRGASVFAIAKSEREVPVWRSSDLSPGNVSRTDERGQYRLFDLPLGQYLIAVSYAGLSAALGSGFVLYPGNARPKLFVVSGGTEIGGVDFTLLPGVLFTVSGRVLSREPDSRFSLSLVESNYPELAVATALTDTDGTFHIEGVPSGSYDLLASGPVIGRGPYGAILGVEPLFGRAHIDGDGQKVEGINVSLSEGRPTTFVLRSSNGHGAEAACSHGATLTLRPIENWGTTLDLTAQMQMGKENTIDRVPGARYHLNVVALDDSCYPVGIPNLDLTRERDSAPLPILLVEGGRIRGNLIGTNEPENFEVLLTSYRPAMGTVQIAYPDAESRFAFTALDPGSYRVTVRSALTSIQAMTEPWMLIDVLGGRTTDLELPARASGKR